jgi:hypothetical protein
MLPKANVFVGAGTLAGAWILSVSVTLAGQLSPDAFPLPNPLPWDAPNTPSWVSLSMDEKQTEWFIDVKGVSRLTPEIVRVPLKAYYQIPVTTPQFQKVVNWKVVLSLYNCRTQEMATQFVQVYGGRGRDGHFGFGETDWYRGATEVLGIYPKHENWQPLEAESLRDWKWSTARSFNSVCHWNKELSAYATLPPESIRAEVNAAMAPIRAQQFAQGYARASGYKCDHIDQLQQAGTITKDQAQAQKVRMSCN